MSSTFDTLEYVHKLKKAGAPEKQAETHAKALSEIIQSNLATRQDLEKTKADLTIEIERTKAELIKWNVDAVFTAVGVVTAIIKLLG